ncbi:hypothetical protein GWI33_015628 [Rhynchophorus ferrugineus]|uniref:Uncharacterized protein n=1 Tax=Rhynchophorus ferrugineus TaxID=354439 RepID=A0A834M4B0_RHYFE|nr:hypothetical protein GWI33_015628 [Rhynchophorus ferrugineus]
MKISVLLLAVLALASAQKKSSQSYTTPVPILKQIDRHNDDGSYSYGYEAADGTYKIETKYPTGEVFGKYGYIDDTGKLREVEYGASRRGFEPAGTDVTVAPPTLRDNPQAQRPLGPDEEDDGQYREDPAVYYNNDPEFIPKAPAYSSYERPSFEMNYSPKTYTPATPAPPTYAPPPRPAYTPSYNRPAQTYSRPAPAYQPPAPAYNSPAPVYNPPAPAYNPPQYNDYYNNRVNNYQPPAPQYSPPPQSAYYNPPAPSPSYTSYNPSQFQGSPAQNVDIWSGSYTVNYR